MAWNETLYDAIHNLGMLRKKYMRLKEVKASIHNVTFDNNVTIEKMNEVAYLDEFLYIQYREKTEFFNSVIELLNKEKEVTESQIKQFAEYKRKIVLNPLEVAKGIKDPFIIDGKDYYFAALFLLDESQYDEIYQPNKVSDAKKQEYIKMVSLIKEEY